MPFFKYFILILVGSFTVSFLKKFQNVYDICVFISLLNIFVAIFIKIYLKTKTFSAHGEDGNSEGIDGRGKLVYNELFLTNAVTTCSIR